MARYTVKIRNARTNEELVNNLFRHRSAAFNACKKLVEKLDEPVLLDIYSAKTGLHTQSMFWGRKTVCEILTDASKKHNQAALLIPGLLDYVCVPAGQKKIMLKGKFSVAAKL